MHIRVKGEGEDKIAQDLMKMVSDDPTSDLKGWIERIGKTAKEICNDPDCKRIKLKTSENGQDIGFDFTDENDVGAMDCVIRAIERHIDSIPIDIKPTFQKIVDDYKSKKENLERS
ncbi:MAG: hypothetical protein GEU26_10600 [Nitrososphaeraceae archaeon]|nr:hypothetical protein [Nitrososphaeraceae archaeon]